MGDVEVEPCAFSMEAHFIRRDFTKRARRFVFAKRKPRGERSTKPPPPRSRAQKIADPPNWVGGGAGGEIMIYYLPKFFRKGKQ